MSRRRLGTCSQSGIKQLFFGFCVGLCSCWGCCLQDECQAHDGAQCTKHPKTHARSLLPVPSIFHVVDSAGTMGFSEVLSLEVEGRTALQTASIECLGFLLWCQGQSRGAAPPSERETVRTVLKQTLAPLSQYRCPRFCLHCSDSKGGPTGCMRSGHATTMWCPEFWNAPPFTQCFPSLTCPSTPQPSPAPAEALVIVSVLRNVQQNVDETRTGARKSSQQT